MLTTSDQVFEKLALLDDQRAIKTDEYDVLVDNPDKYLVEVEASINRLIEEAKTVYPNPSTTRRELMHIAIMTIDQIGDFDEKKFVNMLMEKHYHYGSKPLTKYGMMGMLIKLDTKYERLVKLWGLPLATVASDESAEDTMKDMVGYCILGLIFMKYWGSNIP